MQQGTWEAPGRVNLIGEHTDYDGGLVLPIALEQTTRVRLRTRPDRRVRLRSDRFAEARHADLDALDPGASGWASYPLGVAWALERAGHRLPGFEADFSSDVPVGAGLSSSAAIECALAVALADVAGLGLPPDELAALCRRAENDFVGAPTGGMDQRASLSCTAGHALLLDCRDDTAEQVPFDPAGAGLSLLVVDTRVRHALGEGKYGERRDQCERAGRALGAASLREVCPADVEALDDELLRRRARHVTTENRRVLDAAGLLRGGEVSGLGPLLTESHLSLRDDCEVSCAELDTAVEAALAAGALGARMTGGGFGGSAIVLCADVPRVRAAVEVAFAERGFTAPTYLLASAGPGARRVDGGRR